MWTNWCPFSLNGFKINLPVAKADVFKFLYISTDSSLKKHEWLLSVLTHSTKKSRRLMLMLTHNQSYYLLSNYLSYTLHIVSVQHPQELDSVFSWKIRTLFASPSEFSPEEQWIFQQLTFLCPTWHEQFFFLLV